MKFPQNPRMRPSRNLLKPLMFRDAMEIHMEKPEDGTLFRLPDDILAAIVQNLIDSRVDFRPLALLSPSFRQLARTVLFRIVIFRADQKDYHGILAFLTAEAFERLQNRRIQGQTQKPSLGACIRKVIVNPWYLLDWMNIREWDSRHLESRVQRLTVAHVEVYHEPLIHQVISSLPNLDTSQLCGVTLSQSLLNSLVGSTARTIELCARVTAICPRMRAIVPWPITNLALNLLGDESFHENHSLYCENILRLCAPGLQQLSISNFFPQPLSFNLSFPELTHLDIHRANYIGRSALRSLLLTSKKLHYLEANCAQFSIKDDMDTPDGFVALRNLVIRYTGIHDDIARRPLSFVANLWGLTEFAFAGQTDQELSYYIVEELHHLHRLEKLLLMWDRTCIAERLIEALSTRENTSLEELYLFLDDSVPSNRFLDPDGIEITALAASCRGLKHLSLALWEQQFSPPRATLEENAVNYAKKFPDLEYIRLWGNLYSVCREEDGPRVELKLTLKESRYDTRFLRHFDTIVSGFIRGRIDETEPSAFYISRFD